MYPPTGEDAFLLYKGYHIKKQEASAKQSSRREAIMMVVEDIKKWWKDVGIPLKDTLTIKYMVDCLVDRYADLCKRKGRGGKEKLKREKVLNE